MDINEQLMLYKEMSKRGISISTSLDSCCVEKYPTANDKREFLSFAEKDMSFQNEDSALDFIKKYIDWESIYKPKEEIKETNDKLITFSSFVIFNVGLGAQSAELPEITVLSTSTYDEVETLVKNNAVIYFKKSIPDKDINSINYQVRFKPISN